MSYDKDYLAWTRAQAKSLRTLAALRVNLPVALDLERIAEEMEEMGDNTIDVVEGLIEQIILHLLKLEWSAEVYPRAHWRSEIIAWRRRVANKRRRSPTLIGKIDLPGAYRTARKRASEILPGRFAQQLPADCPYTIDEILDDDVYPVNRHGIEG